MNAAVFLDRDGVLVRERGFITRPDQLEILAGVPQALSALRGAGFRVVIVTNQSALARGLLDETGLAKIHEALSRRLKASGASWDALYCCPHHPTEGQGENRRDCECRKPRPGMLLRAAREMGLDCSRSWMVGDSARDMEAGRAAGCRTLALPGPDGVSPEGADLQAPSLEAAARGILELARGLPRG